LSQGKIKLCELRAGHRNYGAVVNENSDVNDTIHKYESIKLCGEIVSSAYITRLLKKLCNFIHTTPITFSIIILGMSIDTKLHIDIEDGDIDIESFYQVITF
jgi:hypothetical protein